MSEVVLTVELDGITLDTEAFMLDRHFVSPATLVTVDSTSVGQL